MLMSFLCYVAKRSSLKLFPPPSEYRVPWTVATKNFTFSKTKIENKSRGQSFKMKVMVRLRKRKLRQQRRKTLATAATAARAATAATNATAELTLATLEAQNLMLRRIRGLVKTILSIYM